MDRLVIRSPGGPEARKLARLVRERAPELRCRACGGRDFGMLEEPDSSGLRTKLRRFVGANYTSFRGQDLVTLICTRCGQLEQFAEAVLTGARPDEYGPEVADGG